MKTVGQTKTTQPGRVLTQLAGEQHTGSLVVDGPLGGSLHLVDGYVTYAESPAAPGVGELLTASGRLAARTWQSALDMGSADGSVGRILVEQGHLTQGELELCVLGAMYDAAYFVLQHAPVPVGVVANAAHWLGPVIRVDATAVDRETRRRQRLLDEIFPHPELDRAPVTPVTRPPVERVALTSLQWELLVHADGQRTPADLAQLLGRAGYATLQELRKLASQGLLELPSPASSGFVTLPRGGGPYAGVERRPVEVITVSPGPAASVPIVPGNDQPPAAAARKENGINDSDPDRPPRLPRRKPNARLPKAMAAAATPAHRGADEVLLKRISTALRALR